MKCVKAELNKELIPTYIPKKAHELPMFFENKPYQGASGKVYPIPYCDGISDEKTDVECMCFTAMSLLMMAIPKRRSRFILTV